MKIIDTHAHLDEILDIDSALVRAYQSGVRAVMAPGVDGKSSKKNFELSQRQQDGWPKIYVAVGMHPSQANENDLNDCIAFISHQ
ncbi:MAG TPA: TatD family hydrolase, partial [Candidatus Omnitrophota bacterium]|nr:TatD family hydrolase [Candidatus Omnitrophota bacterium]